MGDGTTRGVFWGVVANLLATALIAGGLWLAGLSDSPYLLALGAACVVLTVTQVATYVKLRELRERHLLAERFEDIETWTGLESFRVALAGSDLQPSEALDEVRVSLDFMGHGASKWSDEPRKMKEMLLRLRDNAASAGRVRLLIVDPTCHSCHEKSLLRYPEDPEYLPRKIVSSLLRLEQLHQAHDNLHIKLYAHPPAFRITIINHARVIVGHYRDYLRDSGSSPLLVFGHESDWSFTSPFHQLFESEWEKAERVDWDRIRQLASELQIAPPAVLGGSGR